MDRRSEGLFVTLEGIEGAGKSTQARLLARAVEAAGHRVALTWEPGGGGRVGAELRALLKDPDVWRHLGLAEIWLYAAARAHHVEAVIAPALADGAVVVCDRYLDSTRAYQGYGRGRPLELIDAIHRHPPLDLAPRRTILLDLPVPAALARARGRGDTDAPGYDDEDVAFFERVRAGYRAIAEREPGRVRVVDASPGVAEVHRGVVAALADLLPGLAPVAEVA